MKVSQTISELIYANQGTHENLQRILYYDSAANALSEAFEIAAKICDQAGNKESAEKIRNLGKP